jgi:hypothetical protein
MCGAGALLLLCEASEMLLYDGEMQGKLPHLQPKVLLCPG